MQVNRISSNFNYAKNSNSGMLDGCVSKKNVPNKNISFGDYDGLIYTYDSESESRKEGYAEEGTLYNCSD